MLREAFMWLAEQVSRSETVQIIAPTQEHGERYWLQHGSKLIEQPVSIGPQRDELFELQSMVDAIQRYKSNASSFGPSALFVGRGSITAVLCDEHRELVLERSRDQLRMELIVSQEFSRLQGLAINRPALDQRAFVNLLRIDLAGCVEPDLVELFKSLQVSGTADGESTVRTGKESMGKRVAAAALSNGRELPDELTINVHVYRNLAGIFAPERVRCAVVMNLEEVKFSLIPMSGQIEDAQRHTDRALQAWLIEALPSDVPVFIGKPVNG